MPSRLNTLSRLELAETFRDVETAIYVDFTGVGAEETYALRKLFHEKDITLRVVKTSIARLALRELGAEIADDTFAGSVGLAYGGDPIHVAKTLMEHRKKHRGSKLKIKGGFLEHKNIAPEEVAALSKLPGRQEMLGIVAGTFAAPITGFVNVQAGIIRKLLYAVEAIKEKKGAGAAAA
jgi:large subunit ribosomal protein L10